MVGPILGRTLITNFFEANFPRVLADLRIEWGLDETDLPDPVKYVPREPDAIDAYPMIAVATGLLGRTEKIEHTVGGGAYRTTYPFEVYAWTLGAGRGPAQDLRDRMGAAVKVMLLSYPTFGAAADGIDAWMDESTFEQSWSDIQKTRAGDHFAAGSMCAFDLVMTEEMGLYGATLTPTVDTVSVRADSGGSPFAVRPTPLPEPVHPAFE